MDSVMRVSARTWCYGKSRVSEKLKHASVLFGDKCIRHIMGTGVRENVHIWAIAKTSMRQPLNCGACGGNSANVLKT